MEQVVLGLGGNIGNVIETFSKAIDVIGSGIGEVKIKSSLYSTEPWGVKNQPNFINMVIMIETNQSPNEVLTNCLLIEKRLGRNRVGQQKWGERLIDIDILFYEDKIIDTLVLKLPHPYIHERNFVLYPLVEILPEFWHPILKKAVKELKNETTDKQNVTLLKDKSL